MQNHIQILSILLFQLFILPPSLAATVNEVRASGLDPASLSLLIAVQNGDVEIVERLIADNVSLEIKDDYGRTPLHVAAEFGHKEIAENLIDGGADIEATTIKSIHVYWFWTPLMSAANWGNVNIAEVLISAGAEVNAREKGSQDDAPILYIAADQGHTAVAELLITNGAEVDSKTTNRLITPLAHAARMGHSDMAKLLVRKGANVNSVDAQTNTPLHRAATSGNVEIAQLLLANGADANANTTGGSNSGQSPLHAAAYGGHIKIANLLLENDADINSANQFGYTPLRLAVAQGNVDMVKLLISGSSEKLVGKTE
jgi:ankyrin repeat protein